MLLSCEIWVIHQLHRGLFLGDFDVFHKLLFGLMPRNLHNRNSGNAPFDNISFDAFRPIFELLSRIVNAASE